MCKTQVSQVLIVTTYLPSGCGIEGHDIQDVINRSNSMSKGLVRFFYPRGYWVQRYCVCSSCIIHTETTGAVIPSLTCCRPCYTPVQWYKCSPPSKNRIWIQNIQQLCNTKGNSAARDLHTEPRCLNVLAGGAVISQSSAVWRNVKGQWTCAVEI